MALRSHWPEYLMEAALLGSLWSLHGLAVLLEHPSSAYSAPSTTRSSNTASWVLLWGAL